MNTSNSSEPAKNHQLYVQILRVKKEGEKKKEICYKKEKKITKPSYLNL